MSEAMSANDRGVSRCLRAVVVVAAAWLGAASCGAQVLSPGAPYDAKSRVERVSAYVFLDMRPEFMPDGFRRKFKEKLSQELSRSGVPNQELWFADTDAGRDLIANPAAYTAARMTEIPIGKTMRENVAKDREFRPTHWLFIYPSESSPSRDGAVLTVRWEFKDTRTGYIDWSIFSVTHALWRTMDPADAEQAAADYVDGMVAELRRCKVIADAQP